MAHPPGIPALESKELGAGHVKDLPSAKPHCRVFLAIRLLQASPNITICFASTSIHLGQPVLARSGVVLPTDPPLHLEREVVLEEVQQVGAGHGAAREEVRAHPAVDLEIIGRVAVREDVHEQFSPGFQGRGDLAHQQRVVLHVLKQLDRNDPVESLGLLAVGEVVRDDIARDDRQIGQTFGFGLGFDLDLLGARVRKSRDVGPGEPLGEIQTRGPPAAAEVEDVLAVAQVGALDVQVQHGLFGLGQRLAAARVQTARVLHARAEAGAHQPRRHLVVLRVGRRGLDRHRPRAQRRHIRHLALPGLRRRRRRGYLVERLALRQLSPDPHADQPCRQPAVVEEVFCRVVALDS